MARRGRRFRRHRKGMLPKSIGGWVGFTFKAIGAAVTAAPAIGVLGKHISGQYSDWSTTPNDLLYAYTGVTAAGAINPAQTSAGIGSIAGGVALIFVGKFLGKVIH